MAVIKQVSNLKRYKEILSSFKKNGLSFLFLRKNLKHATSTFDSFRIDNPQIDKKTVGRKLRKTFEDLGPAFVKLGQLLATRSDIIGEEIAFELSKLLDDVPPFDYSLAKKELEQEFGDTVDSIFESFSETPVASASIAQVYDATLKSGLRVAVKVRRPGIERIIATDSRIMKSIARYMDKYTKYGQLYDFKGVVHEFCSAMNKELDFIHEAETTEKIADNLNKMYGVDCPKIKWVYTTRRVLTMEYIDGFKIDDRMALESAGIDPSSIAECFITSLLYQILHDGVFQADPHPGNEIISKDGTIYFIDLGMSGTINETFRKHMTNFLIGMSFNNTNIIAKSIIDIGICNEHVNEYLFEQEIANLMDKFVYDPLKNVKIVEVFSSVQKAALKYRIKIPKEFTMIAKSLGSAQRIVEVLDPELNMITISKKVVRQMGLNYIGSEKVLYDGLSDALNWQDVLRTAPVAVGRFLRKAQENDFAVDINVKDLKETNRIASHSLSRLTLAVVLLAVSIILAGMLIAIVQFASIKGIDTLNVILAVMGAVVCIIVGILIWMLITGIRDIKNRNNK